MATNVVMPQLGESVVEGTVGKWFKKVGDKVDLYEPIFEVITDKVTTEVPSPSAGTLLQILVPEGATVKAGTMLAVIGAADEKVEAVAAPPAKTQQQLAMVGAAQPSAAPASTASKSNGGTSQRLTPVVARMLAENNISDTELATIHGTGDGGRVSKKDIENFLKTREHPERSREAAESKDAKQVQTPAWEQPGTGELFRPSEEVYDRSAAPKPAIASTQTTAMPGEGQELVPLSPMRKAIADHMVRSKQVAPHVTSVHEADMSRVIAYQKAHEAEFAKQGVKLTFTAFFVQAAVAALKAWPIVNASYTDQGIMMKRDINVGIAVAMEDGLIVPVIKHADDKSLLGTARMVNDLAKRAREKKLQLDEVQGGTFTITNYGIFGSLFGMPVINQPQSAIMGVGTIQKRVVVINDAIAIRPMIYLSITLDHRLLDGAIGDQFMQKVKQFLEEHPAS